MIGPLHGIKVVELAGLGAAPFVAMLLADLGAEVVRVDRAADVGRPAIDAVLRRGRRSVAVDLKQPAGAEAVLRLAERADALVEGFRPGVAERLGVGPDACLARNPRLVYCRMTGWGQDGPLAGAAGHDIDYIAVAGVLGAMGPAGRRPVPPLNLVADFGGGGALGALGVVAALLAAARGGGGQVVDAAMLDGAALLSTLFHGLLATGAWTGERGANLLDGGAPFYDVYDTADGLHLAIGPLEPAFWDLLTTKLGFDPGELPDRMDRSAWPALRERLATVFRTRTRDEWCALLEGTDACVAPVLSLTEAPDHPHNRHRRTFIDIDGVTQPAPAPRFSRTSPPVPARPPRPGEHTAEVLADWGFAQADVEELLSTGAVRREE
jgi:alpha-methylacyl-CoA racemase